MTIRAVGFTADPRTGVTLAADQNAAFDFALQKGTVKWSDISQAQGKQLFPPGKGKDLIVDNCSICHAFQSRMASVRRDADGWKDRVEFMRTAMHFSLFHPDRSGGDIEIEAYLTKLWGPDSVLPKSPADMPEYKSTVTQFSADSLNIVYVEYDMPGPSRMPFSAAPDKNGFVWIPNFGVANKITRLNPKTGEMTDFPHTFSRHCRDSFRRSRLGRFGVVDRARLEQDLGVGIPRRRRLPSSRIPIPREKKAPRRAGRSTRFDSIRAATRGRAAFR